MQATATDTITYQPPALAADTMAQAFRMTAEERADEVAIRTKGDEFSITWGELRGRVDALAGGLASGAASGAVGALRSQRRHPLAWVVAVGALLLLRRPRDALFLLARARGALSLAARATELLGIVTAFRSRKRRGVS